MERTFPRRSFHRFLMSSRFLGCCPTALTLSTILCHSSVLRAMLVYWTCVPKSWGSTRTISSTMTLSSSSEKRGCLWGAMEWCVEFKSSNVAEFCSFVCILTAAVCTANGKPCLKDRCVDSWVRMAWAYFCWRDGGGLVTSTFPPTAGLAVCCGCRIFGGLAAAGQNDRGGLPRRRQNYGGFLTGGKRLLLPRSE
ncbi:hypothetical protein NDU88_012123 [Pleurodeles waltl]|uniref:Secreted protein n=1 Tax=Pleurodeles waltl TaxID=8319 RepID=A0AAV7S5S1_PLEWA|nr:hypothetical protein NDU88_012123 [Pleurodeles waltl]